eukprot:scaffold58874_cov33-Tisochrysis_lutea.AAC.3
MAAMPAWPRTRRRSRRPVATPIDAAISAVRRSIGGGRRERGEGKRERREEGKKTRRKGRRGEGKPDERGAGAAAEEGAKNLPRLQRRAQRQMTKYKRT